MKFGMAVGGTALAALVATLTVTAAFAVPVTLAGFGLIEHVEFDGAPLQLKFTEPVKPSIGIRSKVYFAVSPGVTEADEEPLPVERAKFGG